MAAANLASAEIVTGIIILKTLVRIGCPCTTMQEMPVTLAQKAAYFALMIKSCKVMQGGLSLSANIL